MSIVGAPISTVNRDRRATVAVAVQFAVNGAFFASVLPRLPELRDEIGADTALIGILLTAASAAGLVSSATCKRVIARFGTRRVLVAGGALISLALLFVGLARSWPVALVALAAMFACDVYVDVAMNMQGSWLSGRRSRPIMNRLHGLWSLGAVIGGLIAARLAAAGVSLTTHLAVAAVVLVTLSTTIATQLLPADEVDAEPAADPVVTADNATRLHGVWVRLFVAGLTAVVIETVAIGWAAFRMTDDLGTSASMAAIAYVAVTGGMTVTRFVGDHLSHLLGAERFTIWSAILAMAATTVAAITDIQAITIAAFLMAGLGIAMLMPRLYDVAVRAGSGTAKGLGVLTAGMRIAMIVTPAAIASVAERTSVGTAMAATVVVAGLPFVAAIRRPTADA